MVLLDYSKAFDAINHELLLAKLHHYGLDWTALRWFDDYLRGRTQVVEINGNTSTEKTIRRGVPQGSVLAPLLFAIFTADLCVGLSGSGSSIHLFADDTQLYRPCLPEDVDNAIAAVNADLQKVSEWSRDNGLLLNPLKSVAMCIGLKKTRDRAISKKSCDITLNNSVIDFKEHARNLGVIFDSNLTFQRHVNKLLQNANFKLKSVYRLKKYLHHNIRWKLSDALLLSPFSYCSAVYYNFLTEEFKQKIQKFQNKCLRFSFNLDYRDHVTPVYVSNNILKMSERFMIQYGSIVYNVVKTGKPDYLFTLLLRRQDVHSLHLRFTQEYMIPRHRSQTLKNSFQCRAPAFLNANLSLFSVSSVQTFRRALKNKIREQTVILR